jgi:cytochrome d ubiquinol oxidase subunit II
MIVLWLLIGRGISVELRMHLHMRVWRQFFDGLFCISSLLLTVFYGAALANVIRGVPLADDWYFFLPLWTDFKPGPQPGILDWYTVIGGVVALVALSIHGALYLAVKTEGDLQLRARRFARGAWFFLVATTAVSLPASVAVRPDTLDNYRNFPLLFAVPVLVGISLVGIYIFGGRGADRNAFASSCAYLTLMMVGAATALYPRLLPSSTDPNRDINIQNALSGPHALHAGLMWWGFGMVLAAIYFGIVYRMFRGKVSLLGGYGH